MINDLIFGV